ncbi:MAG: ATP-binding protein [bacterium]|nr:ATP-binding protein [bacterium]
MSESNPFRPGAGVSPPVLAGRDDVLAEFDALVTAVGGSGEGTRPWVVTGTRGVGKTVLLLEFAQRALDAGWEVASIEAGPPEHVARALVRELYVPMHRAWARYSSGRESAKRTAGKNALARAIGVFSSFRMNWDTKGVVSFGIEVKPDASEVHLSGDLGSDLYELLRALGEWLQAEGRAGLITIDEMDAASPEDLAGINKALHRLGQDDLPVPLHLVGAGQPHLLSVLAKANPYAERLYRPFEIGPLTPEAAREALTAPARHLGVAWGKGALEEVLAATWSVPYFLQATGRYAWELKRARTISREDARSAVALAFDEAQGIYRARWDGLTEAQRALVEALAAAGGEASMRELAEFLGRTPAQLGRPRAELVARGIAVAPSSGRLAFTLPGFAEFAARLTDEEGVSEE